MGNVIHTKSGGVSGNGGPILNRVFKERFTGNGILTTFQLDGDIENGTFILGSWMGSSIQIGLPKHATNTSENALYDAGILFVLTRNRIQVVSISPTGLVTLSHPPQTADFFIYYWYKVGPVDQIDDYFRGDFVASMEADFTDLQEKLDLKADLTGATFTGNVVIDDPGFQYEIHDGGNERMVFGYDEIAGFGYIFNTLSGKEQIQFHDGSKLIFMLTGGNVGIGTDTPDGGRLHIKQLVNSSVGGVVVEGTGGPTLKMFVNASNQGVINKGTNVDQVVWEDHGCVIINLISLESSAQFQIDSILRGFLKPRMTTAQMNAIVSPVLGLEITNTDTESDWFYNGNSWVDTNYLSMKWKGAWVDGFYNFNDVVLTSLAQMVVNNPNGTIEDANIRPEGAAFQPFTGILTSTQDIAKQVITGQRYTYASDGVLIDYSFEAIAGNHYEIFSVSDPLGTPVFSQLFNATAVSTGTLTFNLGNIIVLSGSKLDLIKITNEPAATPTITTLNYNYQKPTNSTPPTIGQITQASKELGVIHVNKTDDDSNDNSVFLATLTVGDVFSLSDISWAIQSITDNGTYLSMGVSPATQSSLVGVQAFDFETVVATPITTGENINYFLGSSTVRGLKIVDGDYNDIVPDDNAYDVNITIQKIVKPVDWDFASPLSGNTISGGDNSGVFSESTTLSITDSGQAFVTDSAGTLLANDASTVTDSTKGGVQLGHGNFDVVGSFFDISKITTPCQVTIKIVVEPASNADFGIEYRGFSDKTNIPASLVATQSSSYKGSRTGMDNEVTTAFTYNPSVAAIEALQIYGVSQQSETVTLKFFSIWINKLWQ